MLGCNATAYSNSDNCKSPILVIVPPVAEILNVDVSILLTPMVLKTKSNNLAHSTRDPKTNYLCNWKLLCLLSFLYPAGFQ